MDLPAPVRAALTGMPAHGVPEQAMTLISVDDDGFPHVCLLSRAQLQPRPGGLRVVVTSRRTRAYVGARPRATLVVVTAEAAYYCKLHLTGSLDDGWAAGFDFDLRHCVVDRAPTSLDPLGYVPDSDLEVAEQWTRCRQLLNRLDDHS